MAVVFAVAISMTTGQAAAQKSAVKRGAGKEVVRTEAGKRDGVLRDRGRNSDAARGRTSGRVERSSPRGDDVVLRRDGRVERTRTSRRDRDVITSRRESERRGKEIILNRRSDDERYEGNGRGPKFCQNGSGHPVHGMAWCYEKGFGRTNDRRIVARRDRDLDDVVVIDRDRDRRTRSSRSSGTILDEILGDMRRGPLYDLLMVQR
ncbi:MAG TPA: hypothetical protein VF183_05355 [Acidimicrobiales bacterium]